MLETLKRLWRNRRAIEKLQEERSEQIRHIKNTMYCELHRSYSCAHSTWRKETLDKEIRAIEEEYRKKLSALT